MSRRLALFVLIISLASCRKWKRAEKYVEPDENQAILLKLEGYVACLRDHSKHVFDIADFYFASLSEKVPTSESEVRLSATSSPKDCIDAIVAARELAPALPQLVKAGDAFARSLESLHTLTTAGAKSFDRSKPETYAPEQGRALHPELVTAFSAFDAAQGQLFDEVSRLNRQVHAAQLATPAPPAKGKPSELDVLWNRMLYEAEGLAHLAASPQLRAELPRFIQQLQSYERAFAATITYVTSIGKENDHAETLGNARELVTDGKQLLHRTRDNLAYTEAEKIMIAANNEKDVVGSPAAVLASYNRLVDWPAKQ